MSRHRHLVVASLYLASLLLPAAALGATGSNSASEPQIRMYRYTNEQGTTVTSSKIPPEMAKKGYKIVSMNGTVLEDIPPEPTEAEKKAMDANRISEEAQRERDKLLLLRYSNTGELIQSRDRKLSELKDKIKGQESNLAVINTQLKTEQQSAAGFERAGRTVPEVILKTIEGLYKDQQVVQEEIKTFQESYNTESAQYDEDIKRYEFLQNQRFKKEVLSPKKPAN